MTPTAPMITPSFVHPSLIDLTGKVVVKETLQIQMRQVPANPSL